MNQNKYDEIHMVNDTIIFRENYKWGLLDKDENILLPSLYDYIKYSDNNNILINYDGETFTVKRDKLPIPYTCLYKLEDFNFIKTYHDGKFGIVDNTLKEIVPCKYEDIYFRCNKIWAERKLDDKQFFMTVYSYDGTIHSKKCYTSFPYPNSMYYIPIVSIIKKGKKLYGLVDNESNEIVECLYDKIEFIFDDYDRQQNPSLKNQLVLTLGQGKYIYHLEKGLEPQCYQEVFISTTNRIIDQSLSGIRGYKNNIYFGIRDSNSFSVNDNELSPTTIIDVFQESQLIFSFYPNEMKFTRASRGNAFICQSNTNSLYSIITLHGLVAPFIYSDIYFHDEYTAIRRGGPALDIFVAERISYKLEQKLIEVDLYSSEGKLLLQGIPLDKINWGKNCKYQETISLCADHVITFNAKTGCIVRLPQNNSSFSNSPQKINDINRRYEYVEKCSYNFFKVAKISRLEYPNTENFRDIACFGLIDINGHEILRCQYLSDDITILSFDCIRVFEDGSYRYINGKGSPIKEDLRYYNGDYKVKPIKHGKFLVNDIQKHEYFIADETKHKISEDTFNKISDFNRNGIAVISKGPSKDGLINLDGEIILPCEYILPRSIQDFLNETPSENRYAKIANVKPFSSETRIHFSYHYACINSYGILIIPPEYSDIKLDEDLGYAFVQKNNKYGLFDLSSPSMQTMECVWDNIISCSVDKEQVILASTTSRSCIYDTKLKQILFSLSFKISYVFLHHGDLWGFELENKYIIWDSLNNSILGSYISIGMKQNEYIQVMNQDGWGLYDLNNKNEIIQCLYYDGWYSELKSHSQYLFPHNGVSMVYNDNKFYLINNKQETVSSKYDFIEFQTNKCAIVKKEGKWGLLNSKGQELAFGFDRIKCDRRYTSDLMSFKLDDHWGFIDTDGRTFFFGFDDVSNFYKGYAGVKQGGKWGFINEKGEIVIPCRFAKVDCFSEGLAAVAFKTKWGYIDKYNHTIIPFRYKEAFPFYQGIAKVYDSDRDGEYEYTISKTGRTIEQKFIPSKSDFDYEDAHRESWYAMTDGAYGDYSDDYDGDYDFMGE